MLAGVITIGRPGRRNTLLKPNWQAIQHKTHSTNSPRMSGQYLKHVLSNCDTYVAFC